MQTYSQQLKDPRWQRRRLERLSLSDFSCEKCGSTASTLHVHHPRYFKGRSAWEYGDDELQVLCEDCHKMYHEAAAYLSDLVKSNSSRYEALMGLVAGFLTIDSPCGDTPLAAEGCPRALMVGIVARALLDGPESQIRAVLPHISNLPSPSDCDA